MRVLLVEDNKDLAEAVRGALVKSYAVEVANNAHEGSKKAQAALYDTIVLDIMLPDSDGISLCRELRSQQVSVPILMLTARDRVEDKVAALNAGADDYLTKPFHVAELKARLRALQRRVPVQSATSTLSIKDLRLDLTRREVTYKKQPIGLRRKEFDLLEYFMRHPGHVLTRAMIFDQVWGEQREGRSSNTVDVHVKYLRDKLERPFKTKLIWTVSGVGYKLVM